MPYNRSVQNGEHIGYQISSNHLRKIKLVDKWKEIHSNFRYKFVFSKILTLITHYRAWPTTIFHKKDVSIQTSIDRWSRKLIKGGVHIFYIHSYTHSIAIRYNIIQFLRKLVWSERKDDDKKKNWTKNYETLNKK